MNRGLRIGGRWEAAQDGATLSVDDPGTGEEVGTTAVAGAADVERAVQAAATGGAAWAAMPADERAEVLRRGAGLLDEHIDELAELLTREQGKPIPDSRKEIAFGAEVLRFYAEEGRRVHGSLRQAQHPEIRSLVTYAPVGLVAAIVPWNYPVDLYCWKVAPALAAGCPVIVKPPEESPLAIGRTSELLDEAGLPPGTLADLPGDGPTTGRALVAHPAVRAISATVSTGTGRALMRAGADDLKRVLLELGGQTPFVVLADADVEAAAAAAARRSFSNMGQICIAVNRVLVDERVREPFVEALAEAVGRMVIGHGVDEGVGYGPCTTEAVRERAADHIADALAGGARLVTGGGPLTGGDYDRGRYFAPTVLDDVPVGARVMTEETFGPVAAVHGAAERDLLPLANALPYGLAAYVYGEDLERAWAFAEGLEAGGVGVNVNDVTELQAPFGGWKLSGTARDLGPEGLHGYLQTRHIRLRRRAWSPG
jgi:succinate-semialdehyde dehydrogenase / glutarate-semialdehyde dehydrogenase